MKVHYFPDADKSPHWGAIEALLAPSAQLGGIEPKEPQDLVWIAHEGGTIWAAFTVRVADAVEIRCAGGARLWDWLPQMEAAVCNLARATGRSRVHLRGRREWRRFAKRFGWKFVGNDEAGKPMFEKEV